MNLYFFEIQKIQANTSCKIKTVYVSCGDATAIGSFRDILAPLGYTVVDKWTILGDRQEILAQVEALSFEEKAIVEYHTLVGAEIWMGLIISSMSSLIAYARSVDDKEDFWISLKLTFSWGVSGVGSIGVIPMVLQ
jgi:hypothetical protein